MFKDIAIIKFKDIAILHSLGFNRKFNFNFFRSGMWGNQPKKESEWGGAGWGDPRGGDPRSATAGIDPREMRMDPRDMRAGSSDPMRMLDPREMRIVNNDMRGDPRGISGRLNGSGEMWGQPPQGPHHLHHQPGKLVGPGGNNGGEYKFVIVI